MRALAIALFYAFGTLLGGVGGAVAVRRADRQRASAATICLGYLLGAALMIGAALVELTLGVEPSASRSKTWRAPLSSHGG